MLWTALNGFHWDKNRNQRFVSDEPLQRQVTTTINKVESYHNFRSWIAFGSQGEITSNDPVEMEKRIIYADLVANALILQTVVHITRPTSTTKSKLPLQPGASGLHQP